MLGHMIGFAIGSGPFPCRIRAVRLKPINSIQVGNERFTLAMEWSGQSKFVSQELREWKVDGRVAGLTRSAEGLTFATVDGAGHMVPHDKPAEALELVKRWLAKEAL